MATVAALPIDSTGHSMQSCQMLAAHAERMAGLDLGPDFGGELRDVLVNHRSVHEAGGACVVTADHGNADHMLEPDGSPNTAHSLNPVPLIVTIPGVKLRAHGILADVAPTVLGLLGIPQPAEMTGHTMVLAG